MNDARRHRLLERRDALNLALMLAHVGGERARYHELKRERVAIQRALDEVTGTAPIAA